MRWRALLPLLAAAAALAQGPENVLIVVNRASPVSARIGEHYRARRSSRRPHVPRRSLRNCKNMVSIGVHSPFWEMENLKMEHRRLAASLIAGAALALGLTVPAQAQNNRSFVATTGLDTNNCTSAAYCRTFVSALTVTNSGG